MTELPVAEQEVVEDSRGRIPMTVKIAYSAFMAVLIPWYYHTYGLANFLWFCDVALIVTLVGLWLDSRLLVSSQAVAIVLLQFLWVADLIFNTSGLETRVAEF